MKLLSLGTFDFIEYCLIEEKLFIENTLIKTKNEEYNNDLCRKSHNIFETINITNGALEELGLDKVVTHDDFMITVIKHCKQSFTKTALDYSNPQPYINAKVKHILKQLMEYISKQSTKFSGVFMYKDKCFKSAIYKDAILCGIEKKLDGWAVNVSAWDEGIEVFFSLKND